VTAPVIVKVGGSLFDLPDLGARLEAWLRALCYREVILIAGGGAAADVVRALDHIHHLGEEKSHWLALRSLSVTALFLVHLAPPSLPFCIIDQINQRWEAWDVGSVPVLDLFAFTYEDEETRGALPHRWDVTSDSLAARVALVLGARELILLKSVTIPPDMDWAEASRRGYVDAFFPTIIARGVKARAVNFREWRP
jgi:aspartokinase-like uncharacterized kinase